MNGGTELLCYTTIHINRCRRRRSPHLAPLPFLKVDRAMPTTLAWFVTNRRKKCGSGAFE